MESLDERFWLKILRRLSDFELKIYYNLKNYILIKPVRFGIIGVFTSKHEKNYYIF